MGMNGAEQPAEMDVRFFPGEILPRKTGGAKFQTGCSLPILAFEGIPDGDSTKGIGILKVKRKYTTDVLKVVNIFQHLVIP